MSDLIQLLSSLYIFQTRVRTAARLPRRRRCQSCLWTTIRGVGHVACNLQYKGLLLEYSCRYAEWEWMLDIRGRSSCHEVAAFRGTLSPTAESMETINYRLLDDCNPLSRLQWLFWPSKCLRLIRSRLETRATRRQLPYKWRQICRNSLVFRLLFHLHII